MRLDAVYLNGRITTLDSERPHANAIGVLGGRVVGLDDDLHGVRADRTIDLGGAPVVPGFNDAHHHLSAHGIRLLQLDLRAEAVGSLQELYRCVETHASSLPSGTWVIGAGYDQHRLGAHPHKAALDQVAGDRPVFLQHCSGHLGVVNSAALSKMGLSSSEAISGGTVDAVSGLVSERAVEVAFEVAGPMSAERFIQAIGLASDAALACGITSVTEPGVGTSGMLGNSCSDLAGFVAARKRGLLGVRANVMPVSALLHDLAPYEEQRPWFGLDLGLATGFGDEWLKVSATKFMADGSLVGGTAWLTEPYANRCGQSGFPREDPDEITARIVRAHEFGWQVATHAIGDAAVDLVLDAYETAQRLHPRPDVRHRIEHCGVTRPDQLSRMARLQVVPVPQGRFLHDFGDGFIDALGETRTEWCYRGRSFLHAGLRLPGSSDCPVVAGDPLLGMDSMVNRTTASKNSLAEHESLTPVEALTAFTVGSAYAAHEETVKGTVSVGKFADFIVLSDDLLEVTHERIGAVSVGATVVGGEIRYDDGGIVRAY